jgi:hypothetical protein
MSNQTYASVQINESDAPSDESTEARLQRQYADLDPGIKRQVRGMSDLPADVAAQVDAVSGGRDSGDGVDQIVPDADGNLQHSNTGSASANRVVMGDSPERTNLERHAAAHNALVDEYEQLVDDKGEPLPGQHAEVEWIKGAIASSKASFEFQKARYAEKVAEDAAAHEDQMEADARHFEEQLAERGRKSPTVSRQGSTTKIQFDS